MKHSRNEVLPFHNNVEINSFSIRLCDQTSLKCLTIEERDTDTVYFNKVTRTHILLFGDNLFNDITNKLIVLWTFVKILGDSSVFLRCLMAIRDFGNSSFNSSFNFTIFLLLLTTFLDISCLLLLLSSYPRNSMTLLKHSQRHCCDVTGFKSCLYRPIRFSNVSPRDFIYRGGNSWKSGDMTTLISEIHQL